MAQQKRPRSPGSRNPAPAPRKIAGHGTKESAAADPSAPPDTAPKAAPEGRAEPKSTQKSSSKPAPRTTPKPTPKPTPDPGPRAGRDAGPGILTSPTATKVLSGVLALLLVLGLAELAYLFVFDGSDDEAATPDRPVTVPTSQWRTATEQSAKSVTEILDVSWKEYDKNLDDAAKLMTDKFSKEYASTTADSKPRFIKAKAEYDFAVVGQSVVEATPDKVTTLLFLNQFVYKGEGKQRTGPEVYQVRVEATVVRDGDTWLIDDLDAL